MKKVISVALAVVMLFALCTTTFMSVSAAGATVNGISAQEGDKVTVKFYVVSDGKWEDFQGELTYDYTGLRLNSFEMFTDEGIVTNTAQAGFAFYNGTSFSKPYDFLTEGLFYTAEFTVISEGDYTVANNWIIVDDSKSQPIVDYGPVIDGRLTDRMEVTVTPKPTVTTTSTTATTSTKPTTKPSSATETTTSQTSPTTPPTPFPGAVESITLNKDTASVYTGKTVTLTATVAPDTATNKEVEWTTNNSKVATVSDKGVVKGVSKGTATITATAKDGSGVKASCTVTVRQSITSITLNKKTAAVYTGQKLTLKATVTPSTAYNKTLLWSSSQKSVAKVSNGVVTGLKKGTTTIKVATNDGSKLYSTCKVTVRQAVTKITLSKKSVTVNKGKSVKVKANVNSTAYNKKMSVKAVNGKIVKVSANTATSGKAISIKGLKAGTTKVKFTANDGSKKGATCTVKVK